MRILTQFPVAQMIGTVKNTSLVFSKRNDNNFARANTRSSKKLTSEQLKIHSFMAAATKNWSLLTEAQRSDWQAYADAYFTKDDNGYTVTPSGIATYLRANSIRQVLGLALTSDAPTLAPPAPLTGIEAVAGVAPADLGLTLTHSYTVLTGLSVLVSATPAMRTVAITPQENDQRLVMGVAPASAQPLVATGTDLTFSGIKYPVNDGMRYGVEVRVVRPADGILSNAVFGDFIKSV